ncbi:hypothetical protein [Polyangium jinanense]|uniref:Uncharacterized protein n=1 Tax=Polyangium jinanense TaxID=2829994 RepID=A0A9X3XB67_9BACT|nr:hypothetical protein [Polyangium jinanense]MDC3956758.1 hypothetical protein [Polyangium jinanense]MDC3984821.1 hypothetical protein [Polyangium jinanense]
MSDEVLYSDLGIPEWDPDREPAAEPEAGASPPGPPAQGSIEDMGVRCVARSADGTRAVCTLEVLRPFVLSA